MENSQLYYIEKKPKEISENTPLILLLHGYGSNEEDLFSFANELPCEALIISARAPLNLSFGGYAWYSINFENTGRKYSDTPEAISARELIAEFINEQQKKYNISAKNTFILGFSQGTTLCYSVALSYPKIADKIIALSGFINPDLLPEDIESKDYSNLDFFISHGTVDQVIPVEWANKAPVFLSGLKIKNCYQEYEVGHGVSPKNLFDFKNWIIERIKK